jgi:hypothetical protein
MTKPSLKSPSFPSQPGTVATALLLPPLVARCWPPGATLDALLEAAAISLQAVTAQSGAKNVQDTLFGPA